MTDTVPAVALLFDDIELGGQLREALQERGARIVHEGGVSSLSRQLLQHVAADVLVVNLDDAADDALDQLYEVIDGDRPRVVFNDAQASRTLAGWDRARWARHLAVKVLAVGDIDPPRPEDARGLALPAEAVAAVELRVETVAVTATPDEDPAAPVLVEEASADEPLAQDDDDLPQDPQQEQVVSAESENLAAELEALLAGGELPADDEDESGPGLRYVNGEEPPPLHDGNFAAPEVAAQDEPSLARETAPGSASVAGIPSAAADHLQLSPLIDPSLLTIPASAETPAPAIRATVSAPDGWELLDDDVPAAAPTSARDEKPDAAAFGIEKLSAADFLAPDVEQVAHGVEPTMSLELVSIEEAIAPQLYIRENEMMLDDLGSALSRIVLLGAAANATDSICAFLAGLPAGMRMTFLLTQHLGQQPIAELVEKLAAHCALPVRPIETGSRARIGEVLVAPDGQEVRMRRDGSIELLPNEAAAQSPSIDASFTTAANVFGRDAVAIVFAGRSTDAVAGSQAIHDRGGQVWVESSSGEHFSDMVSSIFAERLVSFSGTPSELAAHLIEVFP